MTQPIGIAQLPPRSAALVGLAVGDALGTTYEFETIDQPPYPTLATRPATSITGGGPFDLPPGAITDDTQMAVALARSLAACGGLDVADVAKQYVAWSEHAFDIGNQTGASLHRIDEGNLPPGAALDVWRASGRRAAGNGSLMRTAPIGVWYADRWRADPSALVDAAIADSLITHADPRCALACAMFDAAIAESIAGDRASMLDAATSALALGAPRLRPHFAETPEDLQAFERACADLVTDLAAARAAEPGVYTAELHVHRTAGFVRVALRLALWHVARGTPWRDAVIDVASRGGDADTNTAIVGALLAARDGLAAIPPEWVATVLAATQRGPADWGDAHHPRHFATCVR
jgi:ADP-ribosyl-[dinitrogen reductase] hydrolase